MAREEKSDFDNSDRLLSALVLAPPLVWFTHLTVSYVWVPSSCATGDWTKLHVFTALALVATIASGWASWTALSRLGYGGTDHGDPIETRKRLMAIVGVVFAVTFAVLVIANEVPNVVLERCG